MVLCFLPHKGVRLPCQGCEAGAYFSWDYTARFYAEAEDFKTALQFLEQAEQRRDVFFKKRMEAFQQDIGLNKEDREMMVERCKLANEQEAQRLMILKAAWKAELDSQSKSD